MASLEEQLESVRREETKVLKRIDDRNKKRGIKCEGCDKLHKIGELAAIQTHWYVPPRGCTEGDYWMSGELQFICPENGVINRLLFNNHDIPWEEREAYENDPEEQFKRGYKKLFREVKQTHSRSYPRSEEFTGEMRNNYYVDRHRRKFGLVEKRKK